MPTPTRTLVLFTRDLRVHDHPALWSAATSGEVVPLAVVEPSLLSRSPNRARFYLECLADLDESLRGCGGALHVRRGDVVTETMRVARAARCDAIALTADVGPYAARRTDRLELACDAAGIELRMFPGNDLIDAGAIAPQGRDGYRVFGPYARAWLAVERRPVAPTIRRLRQRPEVVPLGRRPRPGSVRPTASVPARGGERAGRAQLSAFLRAGVERYGSTRSRPDLGGASRLSPYLRFGCVSPVEAVVRAAEHVGGEAFVRQLAWRDFFRQLLAMEPALGTIDLRPGPRDDRTADPGALDGWTNGRTGVPLVDAGMRQLMAEGWIHNRVRMVAASFLTRRLGIPWQEGAAVFWRLLLDGDTASNAGNWQWIAGTGTDPRRMRAFNPVRQAKRCDPEGAYVRRWIPELRDAPLRLVFGPWKDRWLLDATGYPSPIVPVDG